MFTSTNQAFSTPTSTYIHLAATTQPPPKSTYGLSLMPVMVVIVASFILALRIRNARGTCWIPEEYLISSYIYVLSDPETGQADFPKLEEDAMCPEEGELFKLWMKCKHTSDTSGVESSDPE